MLARFRLFNQPLLTFHSSLPSPFPSLQTLLAGCEGGYNSITLTGYRPPETIGMPGLPLFQAPDWVSSTTAYVWDPAYSVFFTPGRGQGMLLATRDFFVGVLEDKGFKTATRFESGCMFYDISGSAPDE